MSLFDQIAQWHYSNPPEGWERRKIKFLTNIQTSNVDKLSDDDEVPVRLCNYTDVYYNDRITPDLPFMEATASPKEIEKFTLKAGQVLTGIPRMNGQFGHHDRRIATEPGLQQR